MVCCSLSEYWIQYFQGHGLLKDIALFSKDWIVALSDTKMQYVHKTHKLIRPFLIFLR